MGECFANAKDDARLVPCDSHLWAMWAMQPLHVEYSKLKIQIVVIFGYNSCVTTLLILIRRVRGAVVVNIYSGRLLTFTQGQCKFNQS